MVNAVFTCPRCFSTAPVLDGVQFCPHCGLRDAHVAASDSEPLEIKVGGKSYRVCNRIAIGSVSTVYCCRFRAGSREVEGVFKIARDERSNDLIVNEADVLRRLHTADTAGRYTPFVPAVVESFAYGGDSSGEARHANVLRVHEEIQSPDELYTLAEVRSQYPAGIDGRDVAWIWRRLLSVLGFIHTHDVVHAAVLPMHVLIEPREHKLVLIDWCAAVAGAANSRRPVSIVSGGHQGWYKREGASKRPPTPSLDIGLAARCMIELLGGDPVHEEFPATVEAALQRHFRRCLGSGGGKPDAWRLLDDFDRLIEAMWGPRKFRVLTMPPKRRT